jgi:hypothetical protein
MKQFSPDQLIFALLLAAIIVAITLYRMFFMY